MKKTLHHIYWFCKDGGTETVLINWYRNIDKTNIKMDFEIMSDVKLNTDFVQEVRKDGNQFYVHNISYERNALSRIPFYYSLFKHIRHNHYDIFQHHETACPLFLIPCWVAKLAGVKHICVLSHSSLPPTKNLINKIRSKIFQMMITLLGAHRFAVSRTSGEPMFGKNPFTVIYNGIDTKRFSFSPKIRQQVRNQYHWEDRIVYGHVGKMFPVKNHLFLIDIFKHIHTQQPNALLALIGSGELEPEIRAKVNQLGLQSCVEFLGIQPHPEQFYQAFDAFIFPSVYEGLPMAGLEAQTAGLPCFFSAAISTEINVCNSAFISLAEPPEQWAKIILEKMKNFSRKDESTTVKNAGFDIKDTIKKIEKIYIDYE